MEEQAKPKRGRVKGCPPTETSFKPGQTGNPAGRPKIYKSIEELREVIHKECSRYIVSGKMFRDLESMTELKRFNGMMELMNDWVLQNASATTNPLLSNEPKIQVVFGTMPKKETIDLKENQDGKYE